MVSAPKDCRDSVFRFVDLFHPIKARHNDVLQSIPKDPVSLAASLNKHSKLNTSMKSFGVCRKCITGAILHGLRMVEASRHGQETAGLEYAERDDQVSLFLHRESQQGLD